jgi:NADH-quinone oxidoreductase subunit I
LCEEACPKEAIFLTNRIVSVDTVRANFIYGKDKLVEGVAESERIDISDRSKAHRTQ